MCPCRHKWRLFKGHTMRHSNGTGVLLVMDQKMQRKHTAAPLLPESTQFSTDYSILPKFLQRGWRQTAAQCVRMNAVPYTTSLCGSSAGREAVDCSGSVRQPCAVLVVPHKYIVAWTFACAAQRLPSHNIIIAITVSLAKQPLR